MRAFLRPFQLLLYFSLTLIVMDGPGKEEVTKVREAPAPTTRQRHGWHPWGQLLDGRWITSDDLRDSGSPRTGARLDVPPGYRLGVLLGRRGENTRAMEAYTGAKIDRKIGPDYQDYFIIKGSTASVTLASAMMSDFFMAGVECVAENMDILRKIVRGEVADPSAYAQGWGFMRFFPEPQGTKVPPPPPTGKRSMPATAVSSPEKDARAWPSLVSQAEVDQYVLSAVNQGSAKTTLHQTTLESAIKAMMMTSSEDDSDHVSEEDAVSVGPLESVIDGEDEATSIDLREASYEFWAGRAHSRSDAITTAGDNADGDAYAVEGLKEMFEDQGWTLVSYKRRATKGRGRNYDQSQ